MKPFPVYTMPTGETYGCLVRKQGWYNIADSPVDIACPRGYQLHRYCGNCDWFCYQCDTGTYSSSYNSKPEDCTRCTPGMTTRGPGKTSPSDCFLPGTVAANAGPQAGGETPQVTQSLSSLALVRHSSGGLPAAHASAAVALVLAAAIAATAYRP